MIGDTIRTLRTTAGLSQAALAELAGVSRRTVVHTEGGKHPPSYETVVRLAGALKLTVRQRDALLAQRQERPE